MNQAASSLNELNINEATEAKKEADLPRLLNRHGSISNMIDASSQDVLNSRAVVVINRIQSKLNGRDFYSHVASGSNDEDSDEDNSNPVAQASTVEEQVDRLIIEATSVENLCQLFVGWCPFW